MFFSFGNEENEDNIHGLITLELLTHKNEIA